MPDIYIIDKNKEEADIIRSICVNYSVYRNYEMSIKIAEIPPDNSNTNIYFLPYGNDIVNLSKNIRSFSFSYILIIIDNNAQLLKAVNPMISASGFIIRPVGQENLYKLLDCVFNDYSELAERKAIFNFKIKSEEYALPYSKILFFEANNKHVIVRTASQEIECSLSLGYIQEHTPSSFVRIHKSFIINMDHISKVDYSEMEVFFQDGSIAYISRNYKSIFRERFRDYHDSISI